MLFLDLDMESKYECKPILAEHKQLGIPEYHKNPHTYLSYGD